MENFKVFDQLAKKWPSSLVARERVSEFSGGLLHPRTMANIDACGLGPERIKIGRKIAYPVDGLIIWLKARVQNIEV